MTASFTQPMLKEMSNTSLYEHTPYPTKRLTSPYSPSHEVKLTVLTMELQATNEKLQQMMFSIDKLNQKMALIASRLERV